jgi:hypothetical protein
MLLTSLSDYTFRPQALQTWMYNEQMHMVIYITSFGNEWDSNSPPKRVPVVTIQHRDIIKNNGVELRAQCDVIRRSQLFVA